MLLFFEGLHLDYSSGPFLTMNFEFDQDHGPRQAPELDNVFHLICCPTKFQKMLSTKELSQITANLSDVCW